MDDPTFDFYSLTLKKYASLFPLAYSKYHDIIGTENPDLSAFKKAGGKMLTWHGLADQLIYPEGTESYYQMVEAQDPHVRDFYRFFPAPGVGHCGGGAGEVPTDPFDAVVDKLVVHASMHQPARGIAADLPGVERNGANQFGGRVCDVDIVEHDGRAFAAQLQFHWR